MPVPVPGPLPSDAVALVTGAAGGIGRHIVEALTAQGLRVLATDLATPPGGAHAVAADLTDAAAIPFLFDEAERTLGPVRVLVHNATASLRDTFNPDAADLVGKRGDAQLTAASLDRQFAVDARAGGLLIAEFATRLHAHGDTGGRIVTLTSGGVEGFPHEVSYGAAKSALVSFTMSAALELSADGVTANAVHPPITDTGWVDDEVRAFAAADPHFFSVAEPAEVGEVVAFLASDAGRRVTGNIIRMG